jgi:hypothetical protein
MIVGMALISFFAVPSMAAALWFPGEPLVPCGKEVSDFAEEDPSAHEVPCTFDHLMILAGNLIDFAFYLSIPLAAIGFTIAGFTYVTAVGSEAKISKAHGIFRKVGIGFIIVLGAWLIVATIVNTLVSDEAFSLLDEA